MLWVAAMYTVLAILSMTDVVCLACMYAENVQCMSSAGSVYYVGGLSYVMKFYWC